MRKSLFLLRTVLILIFEKCREESYMRLKKLICPIVALFLLVSCFAGTAGASEVQQPVQNVVAVARATGRFTVDVPAKQIYKASSSFPLEAGETVTIKASYSPFSADVDFGLIAPNGRFYYVSVDDGSVDQTIEITQRGEYVFAVRNNSSYSISVSGYVNY